MNELTMEERADVLSLYRKTDCILTEKHNDPYRMLGEVGTQHKVNGIIISLQESGMANFQLILTPLSDITDEDAIEVAKMDYVDGGVDMTKEQLISHGKFVVSDVYNVGATLLYCIADFLRSRSYHLPYRGINLYEAGIAVKPNKTNRNEN